MARPRKIVDTDSLRKLSRMHCTNQEIADFFDISLDTLTRRFADIINKEKSMGKVSLRRLQWQSAEKGYWPAQQWLGKQILNQKEKIDFSEADGFEFSDPDKV